jgi:alpha-glucosidase
VREQIRRGGPSVGDTVGVAVSTQVRLVGGMAAPWWQTGVVYQIYPRSFLDTDGDGIGDLEGIRRRLDYLTWLGVDALWLSPIFPSPMKDFGYDVSDFCDVDPLFGSLADLDGLLAATHERGLRLLLDWVPNHTSDQHPWFSAARRGRTDPHRDWYVWRDPAPDGGPPNDWVAAFPRNTPAWTLDTATGQYYLHLFLREQPDLNWGNPAVVRAMHDVVRFWLDRGVDGFRVDVVHALGKDPALANEPAHLTGIPRAVLNDDPRTHALLRDLRRLVDRYPGDRMLVGEVFLLLARTHAAYYGCGDELHLVFELPAAVSTPWDASAWRERITHVQATHAPIAAWPTWVLSNHDMPRHRTRFGSEAAARAAAVLLLTQRGTPFLYAGEELGLEDAVIPRERALDPGGRDGCRAPLPWDESPHHGWAGTDPWLPWPPDADSRNAAMLERDPASILHLYRRLLAMRRTSPALHRGTLHLLDAPADVVAYERVDQDARFTILVNCSAIEHATGIAGRIVLASDAAAPHPWTGVLAPHQAVVLATDR